MNKQVIILTILPEFGTTGVQTHFNTVNKFITENSEIKSDVITPYTYKKGLLSRIFIKLQYTIYKLFQSNEKFIIFTREDRLNSLKKNLINFIKNQKVDSEFFVYAQDPSSALLVKTIKNINIQRVSLICHYNISEFNEYQMSQNNILENGPLSNYLFRKEIEAVNYVEDIIFPSKYLKDIVIKRLGEQFENKSFVVNNFTDENFELVDNGDIEVDFLIIGTIEQRKNQLYAIQILYELHKLGYSKKLMIIGDGPDFFKIKNVVNELKLSDYVIFKGFLPNAKQYLLKTNFLLHTAIIENFPITLVESLSYGKPICGTKVGGVPEIIDDNYNGILLELDKPYESAKKISKLFDDNVYNFLSKNAKNKFDERFTSKSIVPNLLNLILGEKK